MKEQRARIRGEIPVGGDWVIQPRAVWCFRNLVTGDKATFDCRPDDLKVQFPVTTRTNIFARKGFEWVVGGAK